MRDVGKKDEDESYDPFAGLDKGSVLQVRSPPASLIGAFVHRRACRRSTRGSPGAARRAQETRLFNDPKVRDHGGTIRKCRLLMTQVLYMLGQVRSAAATAAARPLAP